MEHFLFAVIAIAATVAFVMGILSGFWPILLISLLIIVGLGLLMK
jgi:hypothetical protein